ncbi:MAG: cytochrome c maturation protein CcmE [Flavobacteriales bacterium]|nr:cytochrome c maturation protein CcmE [Flavobacteriales bacterium]
MRPKRQRLVLVMLGVLLIGGAVIAGLFAVQQELNVFRSPTEIVEQGFETGKRFRIGGLVEEGTVREEGLLTEFRVTDMTNSVAVTYTGIKPNMFREGQGVVAQGRLNATGVFVAEEVLAKHDENYMPPEVVEALKKSGQWQHAEESGDTSK